MRGRFYPKERTVKDLCRKKRYHTETIDEISVWVVGNRGKQQE